jgi:outer membrane protein OmpA-like peptidoglycan-associated protein
MSNVSRAGRALAITAATASFAFALTEPANAESGEGFSLDLFEPAPAQGHAILGVGSSRTLEHGRLSFGLFTTYLDDPLTLIDEEDRSTVLARFVDHRVRTDLQAAIGLFELLEFGLSMPLIVDQAGDDLAPLGRGGERVGGFSPGDLSIVTRVAVLSPEEGFGLHLGARLTLPTGSQSQYASDGAVRIEPMVNLGYHSEAFEVSLDASFELRTPRTSGTYVSDDMVRWGLGVRVPVIDELAILGSAQGTLQTADAIDPFDREAALDDAPAVSIEALAAVEIEPSTGLTLTAGGGTSLVRAVGSPDARGFFAVTFAFGGKPPGPDTDGDGVEDAEDGCPAEPEDEDDFDDDDGCPDLDNDGDGFLDSADRCPRSPEDKDGYQDDDGCPDGEPVKVAARDDCPGEPEDEDGYQDDDGCPDPDNDGDGVLDVADKCPLDREDKDGFADTDGCPEPDNDGDGVLDAADRCPTQGEVINQVDDTDGCPDTTVKDVKITTNAILIEKRVDFGLDSDRILPGSLAILDAVATVLRENPWMTKVRVESHTDSEGTDEANLKLTSKRAQAVVAYLGTKGVDVSRLEPVGAGESRPIATNFNPAGRAKNRRVEFVILEASGEPVKSGP